MGTVKLRAILSKIIVFRSVKEALAKSLRVFTSSLASQFRTGSSGAASSSSRCRPPYHNYPRHNHLRHSQSPSKDAKDGDGDEVRRGAGGRCHLSSTHA